MNRIVTLAGVAGLAMLTAANSRVPQLARKVYAADCRLD